MLFLFKKLNNIVYLARERLTIDLVAVIAAIVLVVASPSRGNALAVFTSEFGFRALPVLVLANGLDLVAAVSTIVGKVAQPLFRHATIVGALKVGVGVALGAILRTFVRSVATVVLAVAEQPLGNATIVGLTRATLPAGGTVSLATLERRLVAVVPAIVVEIAHPQLWYALAVLAAELGVWIALSVVCV